MGIEERHFLVCQASSIRSSRTRTESAKMGKGGTGSTGPHEVDRGRVEAKTQTRMIGTAPTEITNPVGSTALVGFMAFRSRDPSCPSLVPSPLVCGVPNIFIMRQDSV